MTESGAQVVRGCAFVAALGVAALLQRVSPHAGLRGNWRINGALAALNTALVAAVCGGCLFGAATWAAERRVGLLRWADGGAARSVVVSIVVLDVVAYGWHRANHTVGVLWRFHQVHHSDEAFTSSTALRFHPGEILLSLPVRLAAIVALGAPVAGVLAFEIAFTLANFVEHGDIALPRRAERVLGLLLITPALHRRHHTRLRRERDSNYGTIFSVWDRAFRTRTPSDSAARVATGVPGIEARSLASALLLPARTS